MACVGLYSLNRLYVLFAEHKIENGYSNLTFLCMTLIALLCASSCIAMEISADIPRRCGWINDYKAFEYHSWYFINSNVYYLWYTVNNVVYLLWECSILSMFVLKMQSVTHCVGDHDDLTATHLTMVIRIEKEMTRIIILTTLYITACTVDMVWYISYWYFDAVAIALDQYCGSYGHLFICGFMDVVRPMTMSYAVYLMQRHNALEYGQFLKYSTMCRLHHCCWNCREAVLKQRSYFWINGNVRKVMIQ